MAQIFHRSTNTLAKITLFGAVFIVAAVAWVFATLDRSSYNTGQGVTLEQPVPFSHDHHIVALGIDCRYCHTSVETSSFAGIPPVSTCMNCHKLIWNDSPMLAPVREAFKNGQPIQWTRVNDLPDFVYFNHGIHVAKGVGCVTCHGRVDQMPLMRQAESLQMEWCIDCHRDPSRFLRPRSEIVNMEWAPANPEALSAKLMTEYHVQSNLNCSTCHR